MTTSSASDPMVGHVLDGRYEILGRLARGGMATVYRAQDRRLTRTVAVKVMHDGLGDDVEFSRKFDREARAAAVLSNPHVVSVFDQGRDGGRPYIVMEYVEGLTLRHVISREAPLDPLRALDLLEPVVNALASAHEAGIVHRDVKPENVLISTRGQIKVADFGLARAISSQTATATQGMLMGTVSYLPPELVTVGRTDSRGDVYSTGVVLFEMLTGRKPHTGDVPIQVAYMHVHTDIPAPSAEVEPADGRRAIPPYVDALVRACTRRTPDERPHDGRQLLALLRRTRRALANGVVDDPDLTSDILASVPPGAMAGDMAGNAAGDTVGQGPGGAAPRPAVPGVRGNPAARAEDAIDTRMIGAAAGPTPVPVPTVGAVGTVGTMGAGPWPPAAAAATPPGAAPHARPLAGADRHALPAASRSRATGRRVAGRRRRGSHVVPTSRRRTLRLRRTLTLLLALAVLVLLAWIAVPRVRAAERVTEPTLTQLTRSQASQALAANSLTGEFRDEYSESVARGRVIRTSPAAGETVAKHSTVVAWLSLGPERHAVPQLVGRTQAAATAALANAALAVGVVRHVYSESVPLGTVVSVSQNPGTLLRRGATVDLAVSKGRRPITIPDERSKPAATAIAALRTLGFTVTVTMQQSDTVKQGAIISQSPASGTGHRGDAITLVESKGPATVSVPDTRLKSEADARAALTAAGFKVTVTYSTPSILRLDIVTSQSPTGTAAKGTTITITVS